MLVDPAERRCSTCSGRFAPNTSWADRPWFSSASARRVSSTRSYEAEFYARIYCAGGWYTGDTLDITEATRQGLTLQFGGGPMPEDWYGVLDAVVEGRLDPMPSVGRVIGLDEVPDAIEQARRSEGPPRIVVHPNGDVA